ncbi:MAG: ABC transporter substrate-binding protein [Spirochaetae bacterium HGW-Spirochaetae-8]|nr:MAG: ABC transporter substrate-binding protein [Spirochaetae bacterium HGW-Spirochaetae-8]
MRLFRQTIKVLLFVAILCFASTILIAKGTAESTLSTPAIVFADSRGVMIELQQAPRRIVSLSPNVTETLFALGLGDAVVGRTDYCDFPTEAAVVASMGDLFSPSVEKILSMEPDLVIISTLGQAQTITAVEATGVPIAFLNGSETMEGTYHLINGIGELTGTKSKAQALVASMRQDIASINAKIAGESVPSVYYVAGFGEWGDFTATGDTFIHDLLTLAGGRNIAADAVNWSFQLELLVEADPDYIILPPSWGSTFTDTKAEFIAAPGYRDLSAVKADRLFPVDNGMVERQGPRSAQAVAAIARILHPEVFGTENR